MIKTMIFRCPWHGMLTIGIMVILSLALSACGEPERPTISIHRAAETGDMDQLKRHIHWGTDVNGRDSEGSTPLHLAADKGHVEVAKLLIAKEIDVNVRDQHGNTPLHWAINTGHVEV